MQYIGDFPESATVNIFFTTSDGSGGAVAPSTAFENADIEIYKDNSATQRASDAGVTMTSPFDSTTGLHHVSIDTSDDTDVGFYATGSDYTVILVPDETVDGQTVVKVLAQFSIENRTTYPKADMPTNFADLSVTAYTGRVDVASIEGSDATDQIRDAVVDDATRIDASALNTASAAVGSDGTGLTEAGGTGDHLTAVPWNAAWDAEVQSEVNDGLVALGLDHLVSTSVTGTDVANNSIFAMLVSADASTADWDDFANTTDSLQALRDHIGDGTNLTEAGGTGDQLTAVPWNSSWDAEVQSECTDALNAYDPPTKTEMDAGFSALNDPSAATIASTILAAGDVDGYTVEETLKLCLAALAGKLSGASGTTITIRSAADDADRIVATVDSNGNRTAVVLDASG